MSGDWVRSWFVDGLVVVVREVVVVPVFGAAVAVVGRENDGCVE